MDEEEVRAHEARQLLARFGRNVRQARRLADLTQEGLAERSGMDRSVIGSVERGEREVGVTRAWRLAEGLHVSLDSLLREPRQ